MPKLKWVYIAKNGGIYARFMLFKRSYQLGPFKTEEAAHKAADAARDTMLKVMERKRGYAQVKRGEML